MSESIWIPRSHVQDKDKKTRQKGKKFFVRDRDVVRDWYNAYSLVEYKFQVLANGGNVAADTQSTPINTAFSMVKNLTVGSAGKSLYQADDVYKAIFITNLVEYSNDYSRTVAKDEFWYLDTDNTTMTADAALNKGIQARGALSHDGTTAKTVIPLSCRTNSCPRCSLISNLTCRMTLK